MDLQAFLAHILYQARIKAFQADRPVGQNIHDVICRVKSICIAKCEQYTHRWAGNQAHGRLQHGDAGPLCADQCARHVEAVLRQQLVQGVA